MNWLRARWRDFYERFISLKGSPESIARSFSIGFWIAWCPLIGTHVLLSLLGGLIFRANLPAIYLASWLCNPLTIPGLLMADYKLGQWLLNSEIVTQIDFHAITWRSLLALGLEILLPMLLGGLILGTLNALVAYVPVKRAVIRVRRRRAAALSGGSQ